MSHLLGENRAENQLTAARMQMLIRLAIHERTTSQPDMLPSELSRHLRISRNTVSALLNGLEDQKLIERRIDPDDRRRFLIRLTADGHAAIAEHAPPFAVFVTSLFEALTANEREQLINLLERVIASMYHKAAELGLHPPETLSKETDSSNRK